MCIYNPDAIAYNLGVEKAEDGTIKSDNIGCFVLTAEECEQILKDREEKEGYFNV